MSNDVHQRSITIGGVSAEELVNTYGTPLYAYDTTVIRNKAHAFIDAFKEEEINFQVAYASKAFSTVAMVQLAEHLGLSLDVVSGGELYTAKKAGFPMEKVHFHGNNKSLEEIKEAIELGIGCFVVDNFHELSLLSSESKRQGKVAPVLLRVTPGVEAHTHAYISTGQEDSKFGFDLQAGQAKRAAVEVLEDDSLHLLGLHCHIGSQIFETDGFIEAIDILYRHLQNWKQTLSYEAEVVNTGGGFGIRYTDDDQPLDPSVFVKTIVKAVKEASERSGMAIPEIWIEPGRSIVGEAGSTIYTIGSEKVIENVRHYISVDGGMSDNIRPALYDAKYDAALAHQATPDNEQVTYAIAGKACESGDMLIDAITLPKAKSGDLLIVYSTGAYGYSMASNYNRLAKPAVVFVEQGKHQLVVKRETYEDLVKNDLSLQSLD
ncbi:diaminopimelate decarboxylase [Geomicrobium sp. JCM 19055]|uniref:diaminopimelate decarboxylase n=1 Tax=Geomicrobium sp. JCM 19055 TaxID=1460649 RepID=UPI00045EDCBF|nr:diaminopimelate decarboxylase [Geomicrobium sp. JCM 19055]GAJ98687.1 diaminopimelate decarboxylase [Geomicrobium sp. JCM 19055]